MNWFHQLRFRLQPLFRKERIEAEFSEEIRGHLELLTEAKVAEGMTPEEARRAALREFGGVEPMKERYRAERGFAWLEGFLRDFRFGLRSIRQNPAFATVAILTLAVAIGVNSTIFSLVQNVLLRSAVPLRPAEVACLFTGTKDAAREFRPFSYAEFQTLRETPQVFRDIAALHFNFVSLGRDEALRRTFAFMVSDNFFALMGAPPAAGRFFTAAECRPGAGERVVVVSHELWVRNGGQLGFLGSTLILNGQPHTVVGVTPPGFSGVSALIAPEIWLPLGLFAEVAPAFAEGGRLTDLAAPDSYVLNLFGRFQSGFTLASAGPHLPVLAARLATLPSRDLRPRELMVAKPFSISPTPQDDRQLKLLGALLLGMAGVVLLITCLNLANMLLARATARSGEIAVRLALGASRGQIVRQLVTEGLVLALAGGLLGLLLSAAANAVLQGIALRLLDSMSFSLRLELQPNAAVVAVTFGFCLLATLLFSLAPALRATRTDLVRDLKSPGGEAATGGSWNRFFAGRHVLVMAQMTLSLVLIFAAGLFLRGAMRAGGPEIGFQPAGVLLAELDFSLANTPAPEGRRRALAAVERLRATAGVRAAGLTTLPPYKNEIASIRLARADTARTEKERGAGALLAIVSEGYFESIGVRLLRGRDFAANEAREAGSHRVCVIDEGLATRLFPGQDAIGQRLRTIGSRETGEARELEIVGITARHNQDVIDKNRPAPRIYLPLGQADYQPSIFLTARVAQAEESAAGAIRQELRQLDPDLPVLQLRPLTQFIGQSFNLWMGRIGAAMFGVFGAMALLLATLGVYGVKAYAVQRRTREIGIRLALGADRRSIFGLIMKQGALQTGVSVALGLLLSIPVGRTLAFLLDGIHATDPFLLGGAALVLSLATLVACVIPARRATRVSPLRALRAEG